MPDQILVTAAGGTVGRLLVPLLVKAGARVRAGLHDPRKNPFERLAGIEPVALEFEDADSLEHAFRGVRGAYLVTPQRPESVRYVRAAVEAAGEAGVEHLVRQSVYNVETGYDDIARWHREAEGFIRISALPHTFLRPNSYMQNFVTLYKGSILQHDRFSLPLGRAALSNVDVRDVAAAAAAALLGRSRREAYALTGPQALTGFQMAAILSHVLGRPVAYRDGPEDVGRPPRSAGERAESEALRQLGRQMRAGELAPVTRGVQELTGRRATTFERFVCDHVWAFQRGSEAAGQVA